MPFREDSHARLSSAALTSLDARVETPSYDRVAVTTGIVHFGVGGFHRAHQAMYLDRLMNEGKALDWGICGVGTLPHDARMRDVHGRAGLPLHAGGQAPRRHAGATGDRVDRRATSSPPTTRRRCCEMLADPATRIVSLTITEGGYHVHPVDRRVRRRPTRASRPTSRRAPCRARCSGSSPRRCARRRDRGVPAVHGDVLRQHPGQRATSPSEMITAFARLQGRRRWPTGSSARCRSRTRWSTGSRRSPPTTTRARLAEEFGVEDGWPVVCEPFTQWALEDALQRRTGRRSRTSACSWCRTSSPTS